MRFRNSTILLSVIVLFYVGENCIRRFLGDHVNWHHHEETWYAWEDRRVHNSEPLCIMHSEIAAQHAALLLRSNGTCTRGVMTPLPVLDKLIDAIIAVEIDIFHGFRSEEHTS